ncbi:hypothetical protein, partial [Streptomyces albidoflavus]|uniref:hypothetical protein n=1 Tax=Streptomyces albidoflavus TaxID=1886 RepID=UPI0035D94676
PTSTRPTTTLNTSPNRRLEPTHRASTDSGAVHGESIRLRKGTATQKQVDAVIATIKSDPKTRADMIRVTKAAKEVFESSAKAMKEGRTPQWRFSNDRTDELQALIAAMEKM